MSRKTNAYSVFVTEYARQHCLEWTDAFDRAGQVYKGLSEDIKEAFKVKAKAINEGRRGKVLNIPLQRGPDSKQVEEQRETRIMGDIRERWVEDFVMKSSENELLAKPIYIVSFNVMCHNAENEYIPLEIGIVKFTLLDGIVNKFHKFVDAGPVPVGYASEARLHCESTHQIPFEDFSLATGLDSISYEHIVEEIDAFIQEEEMFDPSLGEFGVRPLFAHPNDIREIGLIQARSCFATIGKKAGNNSFARSLDVLDITKLLYHLYVKFNNQQFFPICVDKMTSSRFDYSAGIGCKFHDDKDCKYCALAQPMKLAFMLADNLCALLGIPLTDNHTPPKSEDLEIIDYKFRDHQRKPKRFPNNNQTENKKPPLVSGIEPPFSSSSSSPIAAFNSPPLAGDGSREPMRRPGIGRGTLRFPRS
ncbi:germ-plasm component protein maelstrom [Brevipalpus obovatus]|uniref:germ-plasm component protein maelstrom n=1 Tax=Brevipalpus obovatus TaxID=246614 RepID=UPI003D9FA51C